MTANIIDGKALASEFRAEIKSEVEQLKKKNITPGLAVIIVGEDPASTTYVNAKKKACENSGIYSEVICLPEETTEAKLLQEIDKLNQSANIHGILVQLPLPEHISEKAVINKIDPAKDVDGFHPVSVGNLVIGEKAFLPCTPHGILKMIQKTGTDIAGKNVVVLGRSNIVGKPISLLLLRENATVTICHSKTKNLTDVTKSADILVVACGRPHMVGREHVGQGAVVIDVGINRTDEGKLIGDVDFDAVKDIAGYISPVPGGVGPMTITMLLFNTLEAAKR